MAMALNLQANGTGTGKKLGWLVWWTIEGKDLDTQEVTKAAIAANVPAWVVSRISGRGEKAAWMVATQTGVKGIERPRTAADPLDAMVRYMTKDVNPTCRAIVREVLDPALKVVGSVTVAQVFFTTDPAKRFQFLITPSGQVFDAEVTAILQGMFLDYQARIGVTDYGRIRALIIDWLIQANRVTVRGSGGVYLVPRPKDKKVADQVQGELVALANWIGSTPIVSLFSIVEVSDQGATTVQVFQKAAIDELKGELDEIDQKLTTWAKNPQMNAGSMAYSAGTMLDRVDELGKKVEALIDALGEEIGIVQIAMDAVMQRAKTVQLAAQADVTQYQVAKNAQTFAAKKAAKEAKTQTPVKAPGKPVAAPNAAKPIQVPSVPLKPVEQVQAELKAAKTGTVEAVQTQDASVTLIKNWDDVTPVIPQAQTPVKAQAGTNGKKSGVSAKQTKKL